jgi:hypothetical protein
MLSEAPELASNILVALQTRRFVKYGEWARSRSMVIGRSSMSAS